MHPQFEEMHPKWFNRANYYSGSIGDFRYSFLMDKQEKVIHAATYSVYCYEVARDVENRDYAWDETGVAELKAWLQSQYEAYCRAHLDKKA